MSNSAGNQNVFIGSNTGVSSNADSNTFVGASAATATPPVRRIHISECRTGSCTSGSTAVTGAVVGHPVAVSASDGSLPDGLTVLSAAVTAANTVTVQICAIANNTPAARTYNVFTQ